MYHLFDKIYIMSDINICHYVDSEAQGIIISPKKSAYFDDTVISDNHHYNVNEYSELVGEGKEFETDVEFFEYLSSKIHMSRSTHKIYCDDHNMILLMIKYLKMMFPNIMSDAAYMWYKCYFNKVRMIFGYTDISQPWHKDAWLEKMWFEYQNKQPYYHEDFRRVFNKTTVTGDVTKLRNKLKDRSEFSFSVISYLLNKHEDPNFSDSDIETKIKYMYFRTLDIELNKIKIDVIEGVYALDKLYPDIHCNYTLTPEEIISQVPELSFVLDTKIGSSFWYWDHYNNYDVPKLIKTVEDYLTKRSELYGNGNMAAHAYCPIGLFDLLKKDDYTAIEILEFLQKNLYFSEIVLSREKNIKFNYYFLSHILDSWKNNRIDVLKYFS